MLEQFVPGAATAIGSVPHDDPTAAIEFVFRHAHLLPAAPQLSAARPSEAMLVQAVAGIPGLHASADRIEVDCNYLPSIDSCATLAAGLPDESFATTRAFLDAFSNSAATAHFGRGLKLQLLGPATLAIALHRGGLPSASAVLYAGAITGARIAALAELAEPARQGAPLLLTLDEPGLGLYATGEGPGDVAHAVDLLSGALARVDRVAATGVHCCGPGAIAHALAAGPDVVFAPVELVSERDCFALGEFIERGGWVGWGAVPAPGPVGENANVFWRHLVSIWNEVVRAGASPARMRTQSLVTAACGLAGHSAELADHVAHLVAEVASRAQQQAVGVRIQLGA